MTPRVSRTCQPFFPVSDIPWGKKKHQTTKHLSFFQIQKMLALPRLEAMSSRRRYRGTVGPVGGSLWKSWRWLIFGAPKPLEDMMARCKTFQDPKG